MQQFMQRLAWRNLSLRVKIGTLFSILMLAIVLSTLASRSVYARLRTELQERGTLAFEMGSLAQNIQLNVESIQRLEQRVVEQRFGWGSYELSRVRLQDDHEVLIQNLEADATQLLASAEQILDTQEVVNVSIEVRGIQTNATSSAENFENILEIIDQLAIPNTGLLDRIEDHIDTLEDLTLEQEDEELTTQMLLLQILGQSVMLTGDQDDLEDLQAAAATYLDIYHDNIPLTLRQEEIPATLELLLADAEEIVTQLGQLQTVYAASQLANTIARDGASRLSTITEIQRTTQLDRVFDIQQNANIVSLIGLFVTLALGVVIVFLFSRSLTDIMGTFLQASRQIEAGNLDVRLPVEGTDEFSQLAENVNAISEQLYGLVEGLEQRVAERTRDLTITADIGRSVTALQNPRDLMFEVVNLIRDRFDYYHAQVFLVDDVRENASLIASTGTAGRELLARRHSLPVGSQSVIGQVTAQNRAIVALDTGLSEVIHRPNPLLPETRSEMALPMRIGDEVIGALDVQSVAPNAFDEDVVAVFQIMADQLAVALDNARLHTALIQLQTELQTRERQETVDAWQTYQRSRDEATMLGYQLQDGRVQPVFSEHPAVLTDALASGTLIVSADGSSEPELAIPIKVRGEIIGAFGFEGATLQNLTEEDLGLVQAVVDRVGLALENLRLVEETSRRVEQEQVLNEITAKIVGSTDVEQILQTTVRELGRVLRAPQTSVQLRREGTDS